MAEKSGKILTAIIAVLLLIYGVLSTAALWPTEKVPAAQLAGKNALFATVGGHRIQYEKTGQGRPLIFVHGFAGSTYTWRRLVPLLAGRFTVYALDLPGFGLSDKPSDYHYDMQTQGSTVLGFMDAMGIKKAALAGHSMGGIIAACSAIESPERIEALVLIEPGFYSKGIPAFLGHLVFPFDRLMARLFYTRSFRKAFLSGSYYDTALVTDEVVEAYTLPTKTPGALDSLVRMFNYIGAGQFENITGRIDRPTLIVWGENKRKANMTDSLQTASRIQREIAGSRLVLIAECGHYVQEEKPAELAQALDDFLKK